MPVWLRLFTFNKMKEFYDKENEENEKAQNQMKKIQSAGIVKPNINSKPTYTAKAPRK